MRPIKRFEMVELVIQANSTATKFNFPDIPQLRSDVTKDIVIRAIETYSVDSVTNDFNGNPPTTMANLLKSSLTLFVGGEESIFRIPLVKLLNVFNSGATIFYTQELNQFENLQVDWTKSYVSTPTGYANGAAFSFVFGIAYQRLKPGTMLALNQARGNFDCLPGSVNMM